MNQNSQVGKGTAEGYRVIVVLDNGPMLVKDFEERAAAIELLFEIDDAKNYSLKTHMVSNDGHGTLVSVDLGHVVSIWMRPRSVGGTFYDDFTPVDSFDGIEGCCITGDDSECMGEQYPDDEYYGESSCVYNDLPPTSRPINMLENLHDVHRVEIRESDGTRVYRDFRSKKDAISVISRMESARSKGVGTIIIDDRIFTSINVNHIVSIDCVPVRMKGFRPIWTIGRCSE